MVRVSVLYPNDGGRFDMDYYMTRHIPLCHRLLDSCGLVRAEVDRGIGTAAPDAPAPFVAIAHLVFTSLDACQKALAQHDAALAADVPNFTTIAPQFQISEMLT
jgi:uncharacterized protein (TIGR02118 family)